MEERKFELVSHFMPSGDQPQAIESLVEGLRDGLKNQVLLGVTGSGKTFTMANIIEKINKPTLVIAHNKTLAAQLCNELREFFPHNKVEFFVSYYDYYQPEAYIASSDTYIEKDMSVNEEIDKLRSSATAALLGRNDTIVVASGSCIYGLGNPQEYLSLQLFYEKGQKIGVKQVVHDLIGINYVRQDAGLVRNSFRYKGDTLEIMGSTTTDIGVRIEFFGDEIEHIYEFDAVSKKIISELSEVSFFPATHYTVGSTRLNNALSEIEKDAEIEVKEFEERGKLIEAQRLKERVAYNVEMIRELGYCSGIENYSRYFDGRKPGEPPFTLLDYFPNGFLTLIDESHMTLPQIRGMYNGDRARKESLVEYGFRLKASFDNRPLNFDEFSSRLGQTIYVSATPGDYEKNLSDNTVEQLIRPTGLLDPEIEVLPTNDQIAVLMDRIKEVTKRNERVLVTTLTKKMAESLTTYLCEHGLKAKYMHSEIDTIERVEIINSLRSGEFDVLVGINLLREGLDLPEVSMVAILDADKEGFLRSEGALIQTIGRAARNEHGKVLMFADVQTGSMKRAIDETNRRRTLQMQFNAEHGITPKTIKKNVVNSLQITKRNPIGKINKQDIPEQIEKLKALMKIASNSLDFENAIKLRDEINALKKRLN
ncbi:MAG: excinuclease ABC subunit UvrB [Christensenellales bacterium]